MRSQESICKTSEKIGLVEDVSDDCERLLNIVVCSNYFLMSKLLFSSSLFFVNLTFKWLLLVFLSYYMSSNTDSDFSLLSSELPSYKLCLAKGKCLANLFL